MYVYVYVFMFVYIIYIYILYIYHIYILYIYISICQYRLGLNAPYNTVLAILASSRSSQETAIAAAGRNILPETGEKMLLST